MPFEMVDEEPEAGTSQEVEAHSAPRKKGEPWPGSAFRLEQFLPGSVYLWACGERGADDGSGGSEDANTVPLSATPELSEVLAAWVILIVSRRIVYLHRRKQVVSTSCCVGGHAFIG